MLLPTTLYNATTTQPDTGLHYSLHLSTDPLSSSIEQRP